MTKNTNRVNSLESNEGLLSEIHSETWGLAISTGRFALLDETSQRSFLSFFGSLNSYNQAIALYNQIMLLGSWEERGKELLKTIEIMAQEIINTGHEIQADSQTSTRKYTL